MYTVHPIREPVVRQSSSSRVKSASAKMREILSSLSKRGRGAAKLEAVSLTVSLKGGKKQEIELPQGTLGALYELVSAIDRGGAAVFALEDELSPEDAARMLRVSRPFVQKLIEQGKLPYRKVGTHYRLLGRDVLAYREQDIARRKAALREIAKLDESMGLG